MRYRAATWTLAGLTALVFATALTLLALDARYIDVGKLVFEAVLAVAVVLYAGTGHLLMVRRPGNAIGLLLALVGLLLALEMLTEQYPLYGLVTAPGSLPAARLVGWFSVLMAVLAVFLLLFLVLLFPDGRLPSRRWRPVRTGFLVVMAASVVSQMQAGQYISGGLTDILDDSKASYPNPLGIFPQHGWFAGFVAAVVIATFAAVLCAVASVFARRRGASPELRKQLAWLGYVGIVTVFWILVLTPGAVLSPGGNDSQHRAVGCDDPDAGGRHPGGLCGGGAEVPAVRHRPADLADRVLRRGDWSAGRGVRGAGAAGRACAAGA
jgi:hypothetical protein